MKRLSVLLVALLLMLAMTAPAAAMKPVNDLDVYYEGPFGPEPIGLPYFDCNFEVMQAGWVRIEKRLWFDETGFPVKAQVKVHGRAHLYHPDYPELALPTKSDLTIHESNFALVEGPALTWDQKSTGRYAHIKLPKGGPLLLHDAEQAWGYAIWYEGADEWEEYLERFAGRWFVPEGAVCEALVP